MKAASNAFLFVPAPKEIREIDDNADISKKTNKLKISLVKIIPFKLPIANNHKEYALPESSGSISDKKIFLD